MMSISASTSVDLSTPCSRWAGSAAHPIFRRQRIHGVLTGFLGSAAQVFIDYHDLRVSKARDGHDCAA